MLETIQLLKIKSLLLPDLTCRVVIPVTIPASVKDVHGVFLSTITPPKLCFITGYPLLSTLALTLATFGALISLAKLAIVVPLNVTLGTVLSVVLFALLA